MTALVCEGQVLAEAPRVMRYEDVITSAEAEHIIRLASDRLQRARISLEAEYGVTEGRSGSNCWLRYDSDPVVGRVGERIANIVGMPLTHAEAIQVVHYGETQEYRPHFDAYDLDTAKGQRCCRYGGQRLVTALVYLNQAEQGGGTAFPRLDIRVQPKPGRMVVFHNTGENTRVPHPDSLHAGLPVDKGEKWAFNVWFHARPMTELQSFAPFSVRTNRATRLFAKAFEAIRSDFDELARGVCITYWDTYGNSHPNLDDLVAGTRVVSLIDRAVTNPLVSNNEPVEATLVSADGLLLDEGRRFTARVYVLIWNGEVYLYNTGFTQTHDAPVSLRPGHQNPLFTAHFPALRQMTQALRPVLADCVAASNEDRYVLLGLDTLFLRDGRVQLIQVNNVPNFVHNDEVNREVNIPFFEAIMRQLLGAEDSRLQRL